MIVSVLKDFTFSRNGIHAECAVKGSTVDVPDGLLIGLLTERYVAVPDVAPPAPTPVIAVITAPLVPESAVMFDPSTATFEELQAFLRSKGIQFHHKTGIEKLRMLCNGEH